MGTSETARYRIAEPSEAGVAELLAEGDAFTLSLYPPEKSYLLSASELDTPRTSILLAESGGAASSAPGPAGAHAEALGMIVLVEQEGGYGELKRFFVRDRARGLGIGTGLISGIEALAWQRGMHTLRLETGPLQHAALRLYERRGWQRIPPYGDYEDDGYSICFQLARPEPNP